MHLTTIFSSHVICFVQIDVTIISELYSMGGGGPFPSQRCCYIAPRDTTPRVIVPKDIVARKNSSPFLGTMAPWNNVSQSIFVYMNKGRFKKEKKKNNWKIPRRGDGGRRGSIFQ